MKDTRFISRAIRQWHVPASSKLDDRVRGEIAEAAPAPAAPAGSEFAPGQIFARFIKKKSIRYTLATTLGLVLLMVLALIHSTTPAWAMNQAIEALKKYKGIHVIGCVNNGSGTTPLEVWARSDATGNLVETGLAKAGNFTTWARDNKTYLYDQTNNMVFEEPGIFFGLDFCFSPKLLAVVAKMKDYKAVESEDPATGQKRVIVTCSIQNLDGPESFLVEFDARTKLLVSMKIWHNLKQAGPPKIEFEKVDYFADLPDGAFSFQPPAGALSTNMPLWVPPANLPLLSDPKAGIPTLGMSREQACQKILDQLWAAFIKKDLARIHQLFPRTTTYSDQMLRDTDDFEVRQVLKIGGIERTGRSKLGPLALVPSWVRYRDGTVREVWMVVQFRETDQGGSCVVHGQRGYALNVKE